MPKPYNVKPLYYGNPLNATQEDPNPPPTKKRPTIKDKNGNRLLIVSELEAISGMTAASIGRHVRIGLLGQPVKLSVLIWHHAKQDWVMNPKTKQNYWSEVQVNDWLIKIDRPRLLPCNQVVHTTYEPHEADADLPREHYIKPKDKELGKDLNDNTVEIVVYDKTEDKKSADLFIPALNLTKEHIPVFLNMLERAQELMK